MRRYRPLARWDLVLVLVVLLLSSGLAGCLSSDPATSPDELGSQQVEPRDPSSWRGLVTSDFGVAFTFTPLGGGQCELWTNATGTAEEDGLVFASGLEPASIDSAPQPAVVDYDFLQPVRRSDAEVEAAHGETEITTGGGDVHTDWVAEEWAQIDVEPREAYRAFVFGSGLAALPENPDLHPTRTEPGWLQNWTSNTSLGYELSCPDGVEFGPTRPITDATLLRSSDFQSTAHAAAYTLNTPYHRAAATLNGIRELSTNETTTLIRGNLGSDPGKVGQLSIADPTGDETTWTIAPCSPEGCLGDFFLVDEGPSGTYTAQLEWASARIPHLEAAFLELGEPAAHPYEVLPSEADRSSPDTS